MEGTHVLAEIITDEYTRPRPVPDAVTEEFFAAADRGELLVQRCADCGHVQFYPRALCVQCGGEPEWLMAQGVGTIYTFSVVRQIGLKPFDSLAPYVVAMIDLPEGVRLMGNVLDSDPFEVEIGMAVEVVMHRVEAGIAVPFWRLSRRAESKR